MLEVGLPGSKALSTDQQQAHFALWAIVKSPLVIGSDLRCALYAACAARALCASCAAFMWTSSMPTVRRGPS